jgi:metallo-beta-lactamase class B
MPRSKVLTDPNQPSKLQTQPKEFTMRAIFSAISIAVTLGACASTRPPASPDTVAAHVAEAERLAGQDLKALLVLCQPAARSRAPQADIDQLVAKQIARTPPEPGRAFDNLFFVGSAWVSAWALKTTDGVILIDALNNEKEAATVLEPGMRKVGLNPAEIRHVLVTHAHGDHYGGARYLVQQHRARVAMSDVDWAVARVKPEVDSSSWDPMPNVDTVLKQGDALVLGGDRVVAQITPGHTVGTISPVFEVKHEGRTHRVLLWGGTAFNFGNDLGRLDSYIEATRRMAAVAQQEGIDVLLSNHPSYDGTVQKLQALKSNLPSAENPFVMGTPGVVRALNVMGSCARAQRDRFAMEPSGIAVRVAPLRDEDSEGEHHHQS